MVPILSQFLELVHPKLASNDTNWIALALAHPSLGQIWGPLLTEQYWMETLGKSILANERVRAVPNLFSVPSRVVPCRVTLFRARIFANRMRATNTCSAADPLHRVRGSFSGIMDR